MRALRIIKAGKGTPAFLVTSPGTVYHVLITGRINMNGVEQHLFTIARIVDTLHVKKAKRKAS